MKYASIITATLGLIMSHCIISCTPEKNTQIIYLDIANCDSINVEIKDLRHTYIYSNQLAGDTVTVTKVLKDRFVHFSTKNNALSDILFSTPYLNKFIYDTSIINFSKLLDTINHSITTSYPKKLSIKLLPSALPHFIDTVFKLKIAINKKDSLIKCFSESPLPDTININMASNFLSFDISSNGSWIYEYLGRVSGPFADSIHIYNEEKREGEIKDSKLTTFADCIKAVQSQSKSDNKDTIAFNLYKRVPIINARPEIYKKDILVKTKNNKVIFSIGLLLGILLTLAGYNKRVRKKIRDIVSKFRGKTQSSQSPVITTMEKGVEENNVSHSGEGEMSPEEQLSQLKKEYAEYSDKINLFFQSLLNIDSEKSKWLEADVKDDENIRQAKSFIKNLFSKQTEISNERDNKDRELTEKEKINSEITIKLNQLQEKSENESRILAINDKVLEKIYEIYFKKTNENSYAKLLSRQDLYNPENEAKLKATLLKSLAGLSYHLKAFLLYRFEEVAITKKDAENLQGLTGDIGELQSKKINAVLQENDNYEANNIGSYLWHLKKYFTEDAYNELDRIMKIY